MSEILKNAKGCDFILQLGEKRKGSKINLLQITDMQFIDSYQRRTPDRLRTDEISAWAPENFDAQCGNQIRSLIAQSDPDLIFITGDMVYGSFDDNGTSFSWFCKFMDSFKIPWAPVFGNHDNESKKGVKWQCEQLENSEYCIFKRGSVTGNGNYSVGIASGDNIIRVMYMIDSNNCRASEDPEVVKEGGIYSDQLELIRTTCRNVKSAAGKAVPGFIAFHIPTEDFITAEVQKGYKTPEHNFYTIGVDTPAKDGDFGFSYGNITPVKTEGNFIDLLKKCNIEATFVGHHHNICTCIYYDGIKWVFGLKTGQYDHHVAGNLGGTLVRLENNEFEVRHIPALAPYAPFPRKAPMFENFFVKDGDAF